MAGHDARAEFEREQEVSASGFETRLSQIGNSLRHARAMLSAGAATINHSARARKLAHPAGFHAGRGV